MKTEEYRLNRQNWYCNTEEVADNVEKAERVVKNVVFQPGDQQGGGQ